MMMGRRRNYFQIWEEMRPILFFLLFITAPISWSKCSDKDKAGNCHECLSDSNCRWCPGRISEVRALCFFGRCTDNLGRGCVQNKEKHSRVCHGFQWLTHQPQCGRESKYALVSDEKDETGTSRNRPVKAEQVAAVGARVLKSGFIVTALLHAVGVSALAGPAAPFLLAAGAIAFLSYDVLEKIHQESLKKQYEHLMLAAQDFMYALEGDDTDKHEPGGLVGALHGMIGVIKSIPELNRHMKMIEDQLQLVEKLESQALSHSQSDSVREALKDTKKRTEAMEPLLEELKQKLHQEQVKLVAQRARVDEAIQTASEETDQIICLAKDIGHRVFGEEFEKMLGIWSKVLAAASVCVVGVDGIVNGAEMASDLVHGGLETATVLGGDLPTAAIHVAEIREFFEHEDENEVRDRVARILCDLENHQMARHMENMMMDSLSQANEFVVPGVRRVDTSRSSSVVCSEEEEESTKSVESSDLETAVRMSEHSFSRLSSRMTCRSASSSDASLRGGDSSSSLQPPSHPVVSASHVGDFKPGQSKTVVYSNGQSSTLKRRNVQDSNHE